LKQHQETVVISARSRGLEEITPAVAEAVRRAGIATGICVLFLRHTSASLVIQENADPTARADLERWFERTVPDGDPAHRHTAEGPDDMPSHIRTALTSTSETIPVTGGRLALGTWQGIYLFEHRRRPSRREVVVHVWGE
jgi:secondary thiamine-phosphate synthase enzyme